MAEANIAELTIPTPDNKRTRSSRLKGIIRGKIADRFQRTPDIGTFHPGVIEDPEKEILYGDVARELSPKGEGAYKFSPQDWAEWLRRHISSIQKMPKEVRTNAGTLMHEFVGGVNDMYEEHLRKGNEFPERPHIGVELFSDTAGAGDGRIWIGKDYLLRFARKPLDTPETILSPYADKQTIASYGTPKQEVRSTGVHECSHAQYQQTHPEELATFEQIFPENMSQARYDAKPNELHAIREELAYVKQKAYPQQAIDALRKRIAAAENYQLNQTRQTIANEA